MVVELMSSVSIHRTVAKAVDKTLQNARIAMLPQRELLLELDILFLYNIKGKIKTLRVVPQTGKNVAELHANRNIEKQTEHRFKIDFAVTGLLQKNGVYTVHVFKYVSG